MRTPTIMKAVRFKRASAEGVPYSEENPPPASALYIQDDIPIPHVTRPDELLVEIKAVSVIRDNLAWPELFCYNPAQLGNDFAGRVVEVHPDEKVFRVGDQVCGMVNASRGGTWAEYALVTVDEAYFKPSTLSWEEAAAVPLSALTADQALFVHGALDMDTSNGKRVLITGASGGVGIYLVHLAAAAGHGVIAACGSIPRDQSSVLELGAEAVISYDEIPGQEQFDVIVDTRGERILQACWKAIQPDGRLMSINAASWNFVAEHKEQDVPGWKSSVHAAFFIVEPSTASMKRISALAERDTMKIFVSRVMPLTSVVEAYALCQDGGARKGKIVMVV